MGLPLEPPGQLGRFGEGSAGLVISATNYGQNVMASTPVLIALVRPVLGFSAHRHPSNL
jgi:hypothetical protein